MTKCAASLITHAHRYAYSSRSYTLEVHLWFKIFQGPCKRVKAWCTLTNSGQKKRCSLLLHETLHGWLQSCPVHQFFNRRTNRLLWINIITFNQTRSLVQGAAKAKPRRGCWREIADVEAVWYEGMAVWWRLGMEDWKCQEWVAPPEADSPSCVFSFILRIIRPFSHIPSHFLFVPKSVPSSAHLTSLHFFFFFSCSPVFRFFPHPTFVSLSLECLPRQSRHQ